MNTGGCVHYAQTPWPHPSHQVKPQLAAAVLGPIYTDRVLPTQLDGDPDAWRRARESGQPAPGIPTCSLSQPSLTADMLETLQLTSSPP